jgi:hypothetical protein
MAIVQSPIAIFWYSVLNVVAKRKRTGITQTVEGKTFKLHVSQTKNYWQTTFRSSPTGCWSNEWLLWCVVGRRHLVIVCRRSSFPLSCPVVVICSFRLAPRFRKQFLDLGATRKNPKNRNVDRAFQCCVAFRTCHPSNKGCKERGASEHWKAHSTLRFMMNIERRIPRYDLWCVITLSLRFGMSEMSRFRDYGISGFRDFGLSVFRDF